MANQTGMKKTTTFFITHKLNLTSSHFRKKAYKLIMKTWGLKAYLPELLGLSCLQATLMIIRSKINPLAFSHYKYMGIFRAQGQHILSSVIWSGRKSNLFEILSMSEKSNREKVETSYKPMGALLPWKPAFWSNLPQNPSQPFPLLIKFDYCSLTGFRDIQDPKWVVWSGPKPNWT